MGTDGQEQLPPEKVPTADDAAAVAQALRPGGPADVLAAALARGMAAFAEVPPPYDAAAVNAAAEAAGARADSEAAAAAARARLRMERVTAACAQEDSAQQAHAPGRLHLVRLHRLAECGRSGEQLAARGLLLASPRGGGAAAALASIVAAGLAIDDGALFAARLLALLIDHHSGPLAIPPNTAAKVAQCISKLATAAPALLPALAARLQERCDHHTLSPRDTSAPAIWRTDAAGLEFLHTARRVCDCERPGVAQAVAASAPTLVPALARMVRLGAPQAAAAAHTFVQASAAAAALAAASPTLVHALAEHVGTGGPVRLVRAGVDITLDGRIEAGSALLAMQGACPAAAPAALARTLAARGGALAGAWARALTEARADEDSAGRMWVSYDQEGGRLMLARNDRHGGLPMPASDGLQTMITMCMRGAFKAASQEQLRAFARCVRC